MKARIGDGSHDAQIARVLGTVLTTRKLPIHLRLCCGQTVRFARFKTRNMC
jgi:hypothetical protein